MKVGIIQPSYIPWRGYFDFIDEVDLFILLDDVQFTRRDWRSRNRIKTKDGAMWLTVPVHVGSRDALINEVRIDDSQDWAQQHLGSLQRSYARATYFGCYYPELLETYRRGFTLLSDLNTTLIRWLMSKLDINTPIMNAADLQAQGIKTARLINLLQQVGADCYVSGPSAKAYLDEAMFRKHGIRLEYKSYDYPPYPQLWGDFIGDVSVLDLLFNVGPDARKYLKSRSPNEVAVP